MPTQRWWICNKLYILTVKKVLYVSFLILCKVRIPSYNLKIVVNQNTGTLSQCFNWKSMHHCRKRYDWILLPPLISLINYPFLNSCLMFYFTKLFNWEISSNQDAKEMLSQKPVYRNAKNHFLNYLLFISCCTLFFMEQFTNVNLFNLETHYLLLLLFFFTWNKFSWWKNMYYYSGKNLTNKRLVNTGFMDRAEVFLLVKNVEWFL